jgi:transcriptional regulator CtsR
MRIVLVTFLTILSCLRSASITDNITEVISSSNEDLTQSMMKNVLEEEELLLSDEKKDILSILFDENVLKHTETDFLIRLYDAEMQGKQILRGRKREIGNVLREKIRQIQDLEEILNFLSYAYTNRCENALLLIIESADESKFDIIMKNLKYLDFSFYEHLKSCKSNMKKGPDSDSDYYFVESPVWKEEERPFIPFEVFKNLTKEYRLPAYIRYITNMPFSNDQVNSQFIRDNVLNRFELSIIFDLYELEMMDTFHSHDTKAVIESYLKTKIFNSSNENMADIAAQLFAEELDQSLKLVIDQKFCYKSAILNQFRFQDLYWLFNYAEANCFMEGFYHKVLSLAKPAVVRRYLSKAARKSSPAIKPISDKLYDSDEDEDVEVIEVKVMNKIKA